MSHQPGRRLSCLRPRGAQHPSSHLRLVLVFVSTHPVSCAPRSCHISHASSLGPHASTPKSHSSAKMGEGLSSRRGKAGTVVRSSRVQGVHGPRANPGRGSAHGLVTYTHVEQRSTRERPRGTRREQGERLGGHPAQGWNPRDSNPRSPGLRAAPWGCTAPCWRDPDPDPDPGPGRNRAGTPDPPGDQGKGARGRAGRQEGADETLGFWGWNGTYTGLKVPQKRVHEGDKVPQGDSRCGQIDSCTPNAIQAK